MWPHIVTVGRVPTVGAALHTIHCRERGVEVFTAGIALILSLAAVEGWGRLPDARWMPFPTFRSVARYPFGGRTGPGGLGPAHIVRSSGREELAVDAGEKYTSECPAGCCNTPGRLIDGVVSPFSPPVVRVAYLGISRCFVGGKITTHFLNGKTSCVIRGIP